MRDEGFTLVELMVVVIILGVLAFMGIPQYMRTVENSKADDAVATLNMLGQANRMYNLNNPGNWSSSGGPITNTDVLVTGNYVAAQDWTNKPWNFYTNNPTAGGIVATANRNTTASSPYNGWGYTLSNTGSIVVVGNAPTPAR